MVSTGPCPQVASATTACSSSKANDWHQGHYGPDEIWHVDTTLIRLLDGSKSYLHAVIDNFSRRVLAWRVNDTFIPAVTAELLVEAGREIEDTKPQLLVDGGVENYNSAVDKLVDSGLLKRILAQTEIRYSNSLIESWWRVIKHQWLFLNTLDTAASVRKLVVHSTSINTTAICHTRRSRGRRRTRCTLEREMVFRRSWKKRSCKPGN